MPLLAQSQRFCDLVKGRLISVSYIYIYIHTIILVKAFRVVLDSNLSMKDHVSRICRTSYYQLRQLRVIRRSLTTGACTQLVHALVNSRLYCFQRHPGEVSLATHTTENNSQTLSHRLQVPSRRGLCQMLTPLLGIQHLRPIFDF